MIKLLVATPTYDGAVRNARAIVDLHQSPPHPKQVSYRTYQSSLLTLNRNRALADALNDRCSHLLFLDADVEPLDEGWFATLLGEMEAYAADVMAAVVPFKDGSDDTSAALERGQDGFDAENMRKLAVHAAGPTFTDRRLLVATGCMLVDLRRQWSGTALFSTVDGMSCPGGKWEARVFPEDWFFCRAVRRLGGSVWATTKVRVAHWDGRTPHVL